MLFKYRYYVRPGDGKVKLCVTLFGLSFILRVWWTFGWEENREGLLWLTRGVFPITAAALFPVTILKYGRKKLYITLIPLFIGIVFFILKAQSFSLWHNIFCTVLYLTVLFLYGSVVLGMHSRKKLLIPLFGLPLAYHIMVEDVRHLGVYVLPQWVQEFSVLLIIGGMLLLSLAIREKDEVDK